MTRTGRYPVESNAPTSPKKTPKASWRAVAVLIIGIAIVEIPKHIPSLAKYAPLRSLGVAMVIGGLVYGTIWRFHHYQGWLLSYPKGRPWEVSPRAEKWINFEVQLIIPVFLTVGVGLLIFAPPERKLGGAAIGFGAAAFMYGYDLLEKRIQQIPNPVTRIRIFNAISIVAFFGAMVTRYLALYLYGHDR